MSRNKEKKYYLTLSPLGGSKNYYYSQFCTKKVLLSPGPPGGPPGFFYCSFDFLDATIFQDSMRLILSCFESCVKPHETFRILLKRKISFPRVRILLKEGGQTQLVQCSMRIVLTLQCSIAGARKFHCHCKFIATQQSLIATASLLQCNKDSHGLQISGRVSFLLGQSQFLK